MLLGVVSIIAVLYNNCYNCCVGSFLTLLTVSPLSQVTRKAEQIVWLASIGSKHYNGSVTRELQFVELDKLRNYNNLEKLRQQSKTSYERSISVARYKNYGAVSVR